MNMNQYSLFEPFNTHCHQTSNKYHYHKKQKHIHSTQQAHLYQNSARKLPIYRNPNPQFPSQATHTSDPTRSVNSGLPRAIVIPPTPTLVKLTNTGKINKMMRNNQPGMMIFLRQTEDVHCILMAAKWDTHVIYRGQNYYTHLIAEFYANMEIKQRDGVFYFSSFVNGKNVYIDHYILNKSLRLGNRPSDLPCINIYEKFVFNQKEFEMFLGLFCDEDVPLGLCAKNCGISFRHFTPKYQKLAIILRENILPKPKHDRFFDFVDIKVMFQLVSNYVEFNINYVLVLNMIYAHLIDYMPYGLLITSIFETYYVQMSRVYTNKIDYFSVEGLVQDKIPLSECKPSTISPISIL
ncbi:hypothetical protein POM88_012926 [Heracleum sosnowskyi]|uniref:Uncharacterized protein n=1 Tax=Heracleum sosnowskyi TaxID=360622 RepID=A0AAD8MXP6_9APIA|nr:hypothetical protein POM88_012926 [Heracleum sosnowskyi]